MIDKIIEIKKLYGDISELLKNNKPKELDKIDNYIADVLLIEILNKYINDDDNY